MGSQRTAGKKAVRRTLACVAWLLAIACLPPQARADDLLLGTLQLRWGDARAARSSRAPSPPLLEAWLDLGPGLRYPLDAAEAMRAAGDLAALSNRRVAVSYVPRKTVGTGFAIDAIVPAGRLPQRAVAQDAEGRVAMAAPVTGTTRWVTLMCKFADVATEPKPRAFFQAQYLSLIHI